MGQTYEIRVTGGVSDEDANALGAVVTGTQQACTVLRGIADQSALQGVLDRVAALGMEILEVRLAPDDPGPSA
jgi:hypothetical protein